MPERNRRQAAVSTKSDCAALPMDGTTTAAHHLRSPEDIGHTWWSLLAAVSLLAVAVLLMGAPPAALGRNYSGAAPAARSGAVLVYDATRQVTVLIGGSASSDI